MSARKEDQNGYISIEQNPITREGVFYYRGKDIGAPIPEQMYGVYRPASEIQDPECIESFKTIPIIDDHTMLGESENGYTPAEEKGVHGITGERVVFGNGVLYANLKIFSEKLKMLIEKGKKDLSLGYRCRYEQESGSFAGKSYEYIQRRLRGNHLALVDKARCDVAVLDTQFAYDHLDLTIEKENPMNKEDPKTADEKAKNEGDEKKEVTLDSLANTLDALAKTVTDMQEEKAKDEKAKDEEKKKADDEAAAEEKAKAKEAADAAPVDEKIQAAMDKVEALEAELAKRDEEAQDADDVRKGIMQEIAARDKLAKAVEKHVGAFDHAEQSLDDVAKYGVEKLELECEDGQELSTLKGYLAAADKIAPATVANDSANKKAKGDFSFKTTMTTAKK